MAHRSRGPWRRLGKHASARRIIAQYRDLDQYPGPTWGTDRLAERFALHRTWIAFQSRFDSMATPPREARERRAWQWRA
jgi:hypothetical protein